jgi:DNA repair exonuclease SbcCD ATPase subunit
MENNEFRKPLIQSAAIIGAIIILIAMLSPSTGSATGGGGVMAIFSGIGNTILFVFGLSFALAFSIFVLVAVFLGAVALNSPESATQMYNDLKKNFSQNLLIFRDRLSSCSNSSGVNLSEEEYDTMIQEIAQLQESNIQFEGKIASLKNELQSLNQDFSELASENDALKAKFEELEQAVISLSSHKKEHEAAISALMEKIEHQSDQDLKEQLSQLTRLQEEAKSGIDVFSKRLDALESSLKQSPTAGIFSYIESKEDQNLFAVAVEEAVSQDMTYSQIDHYLTENLNPELDKIIKEHPALTKTYIRNIKRK